MAFARANFGPLPIQGPTHYYISVFCLVSLSSALGGPDLDNALCKLKLALFFFIDRSKSASVGQVQHTLARYRFFALDPLWTCFFSTQRRFSSDLDSGQVSEFSSTQNAAACQNPDFPSHFFRFVPILIFRLLLLDHLILDYLFFSITHFAESHANALFLFSLPRKNVLSCVCKIERKRE